MKVKLKSWNEVVKLAKENGDYDDVTDTVYYLARWAIPWSKWIDATPDKLHILRVEDEYGGYYVKDYMVQSPPDSDKLLTKCKIVTCDNLHTITAESDLRPITGNTCIRLIAYDGGLYYHKTVGGEVVDCRLVGGVYE